MGIQYVTGDATEPQGEGNKIIAHICNDIGLFGAGFAKAVTQKYPRVKEFYLMASKYELGRCQSLYVRRGVWVVNMIAQHGVRSQRNPKPIDYEALRRCLAKIYDTIAAPDRLAFSQGASVHMPRVGTGLAGGDWSIIEPIIEEELCAKGVSVTVYDLPNA